MRNVGLTNKAPDVITRDFSLPLRVAICIAAFLVVSSGVLSAQPPGGDNAASVARSAAATLTRGPYLQIGTPTSVIVRWRTAESTQSRVLYGDAPGNLTDVVSDATSTTEHEIEITGLSPNTRYYYTVGTEAEILAGGDANHYIDTSPLAGSQQPTRIWAIGDGGAPWLDLFPVRDSYLAYAGSRPADLWINYGDNAYMNGTDAEYQAAVFDAFSAQLINTVLWPTIGNHDLIYSGPNNDYYDFFTMPTAGEAGGVPSGHEEYYSFDYANIHFICLDSQHSDRSPTGPMLTWLQNDLAATTQDWVFAYFHHAPYSKGTHDSDTDPRMKDIRENALPILEAGGADLVMAGHSHAYERSFMIDGHYSSSSTFNSSMIVDGGDGDPQGDGAYVKPVVGPSPNSGTVYVVLGSSSWPQTGGSHDHPVMTASMIEPGSIVIDVDGSRLDYVFIDDNQTVLDRFTIIKDASANRAPVASFTATPGSGDVPLAVSFDASASFDPDGDAVTYAWDFGDGATGSGVTAGHTFTQVGSYAVRLTVDDGELTGTTTRTVSVTTPPDPTERLLSHWPLDESSGTTAADIAGSYNGTLVNGPVWQPAGGRIDGSLSFDGVDDRVDLGGMDVEGGSGGMTIALWARVDGFAIADGRLISKATGVNSEDHYWMLSTINDTALRFRLRVGGATTTLVTGTGQIAAGVWCHVAASYDGATMRIYKDGVEVASTPASGAIATNAAVMAALGNQPAGAGDRALTGRLDEVRVYNYALSASEIVDLANPGGPPPNGPPVADFTATPTSGEVPLAVDVDASASSDPDGDNLSYAWDFGDGASGSGVTANHTYTQAGSYTVRLTVSDGELTDTASQTITVTSEPPANRPPVADFTATPTSGIAPLAVDVDASASSDPDGDNLSYAWDFGDGASGSGVTANHTYTQTGSYTVRLTVDDGELSDEMSRIITVVGETDTLDLALGVLQNPYLTQYLDVYLIASEELTPSTVTVTVGGDAVAMERIDAGDHVWRGDYELTGGGAINAQACATSVDGHTSCTSLTMSALWVAAGGGAMVSSPDEVFRVRVPAGGITQDGYLLVMPREAALADEAALSQRPARRAAAGTERLPAYSVGPGALTGGVAVTVAFGLEGVSLPAGVEWSQVYIERVGAGALESRIDRQAGVVRATTRELGEFALAVGAPGTSEIAEVGYARLRQNYPNPFNPSTTIEYEVQTAQQVRITIYDVTGRYVTTLVDAEVPAGIGRVGWDGLSARGEPVGSGVYFVRLETADATATRKLMLVR
jgi:PKD repeat protein